MGKPSDDDNLTNAWWFCLIVWIAVLALTGLFSLVRIYT